MRAASYAVMNRTRASRVFRASGRVEKYYPSVSGKMSAAYGTFIGVVENISRKSIGYIDKSNTMHFYSKTSIVQKMKPYAQKAKKLSKLKDTAGEKNPYRYRGYRYDSETGLYYLQNRYYNPEWGRFINADGIIGETGELLGHNLFAYSKNNWANMSDYSGFRPVYTLGEETEAMRAASYAVMNRTRANRVFRASGRVEKYYPSVSGKMSAAYGTSIGVVENISRKSVGYIDKSNAIHFYPKTSIVQKMYPYAQKAKKLSKWFTVITSGFDISKTWDPSVKMPLWKRALKTGVQVGGIVAGCAVGATISGPLLAAGMAGGTIGTIAAGVGGALAIDYYIGKKIGSMQERIYKKFGME